MEQITGYVIKISPKGIEIGHVTELEAAVFMTFVVLILYYFIYKLAIAMIKYSKN